jgi:hypothetical protein
MRKKRVLKHLHGGSEENNEKRHPTATFLLTDREMKQETHIEDTSIINYVEGPRHSRKPHTIAVYGWMD